MNASPTNLSLTLPGRTYCSDDPTEAFLLVPLADWALEVLELDEGHVRLGRAQDGAILRDPVEERVDLHRRRGRLFGLRVAAAQQQACADERGDHHHGTGRSEKQVPIATRRRRRLPRLCHRAQSACAVRARW